MRLLVVSDEESRYIWDFFDPGFFAEVAMVISCGDLKCSYLEFLSTMIPVPLFYVKGNHDAAIRDNPPGGCTCIEERVETYKGVRLAGLGGCLGLNPKDPLVFSEQQMSKKTVALQRKIRFKGGLDILVTHAPAAGLGDGDDQFHKGFECYRSLIENVKPKVYLFGHQHKRYSYTVETPEQYNDTRIINACGYKIIDY